MYRVFRPELDMVAPDPLDPVKRYHEGIFVQMDPLNNTGTLFHVTGDIMAATGMIYQERGGYVPGVSALLYRNTEIGWVSKDDYHSGKFSTILRALPRPTKQQGINFWEIDPITRKHEIIWTKEDGERYEPGEQRRPIFKCNEWTNLHAIPALRAAGVLRDLA